MHLFVKSKQGSTPTIRAVLSRNWYTQEPRRDVRTATVRERYGAFVRAYAYQTRLSAAPILVP